VLVGGPPSGTRSAHVDVRKWPTGSHLSIQPEAARKLRVSQFYAIDRCFDNAYVARIHAAVMIEVVHTAIPVGIDYHVDSIAILMPALACAAARIAERKIV
jgi:hypothetical protein